MQWVEIISLRCPANINTRFMDQLLEHFPGRHQETKYSGMSRKDNVVEKRGIFGLSYAQSGVVKASDPILRIYKYPGEIL